MTSAKRFTVSRAHEGKALIDVLAEHLECSKKIAKSLLDERRVFVNTRRIWMAKHTVRRGDQIEVQASEPTDEAVELKILLETKDFFVVDKPVGKVSDGADSVESELRTTRREPGIRAVHRLDKDTSGCLLFARNEPARNKAIEEFSSKHVIKEYLLISVGPPPRKLGEVSVALGGKPALSRFALVDSSPKASLIKAALVTGRMHQIRKHLEVLGITIAGDKQYGTSARSQRIEREITRQMLHAWRLKLPALKIAVQAPLPEDFRKLLKLFSLRMS